jgi:ubiquinone biosynthesis monooxygenase Coq7
MNTLDQLITTFDLGLRTVFASPHAGRPYPGTGPEADMGEAERAKAAALMRVNHVGEVCAQALYAGQALTARRTRTGRARRNRPPRLVRNAHQRTRRPQEPA